MSYDPFFFLSKTYVRSSEKRKELVDIFNAEECKAALELGDVQQDVIHAVKVRVRCLQRRGLVKKSDFPTVFFGEDAVDTE